MSKIVFILGAGASKESGAPVMNNFLDIAKDLYSTNAIINESRSHFEQVFRAIGLLQSVHSKSNLDLENIESIFNAFEMGKLINRIPGYDGDIVSLIESLKVLIVETLNKSVKFPCNYKERTIYPTQTYKNFTEAIKSKSKDISIISFNYDVALDYALSCSDMAPYYSLSNEKQRVIKLLKLHGSLNWFLDDDKNIHPVLIDEYIQRLASNLTPVSMLARSDISLNIRENAKEYFKTKNITIDNMPVIVPPAWNKTEYHDALSSVWKQAATELSECEYLFIIGYSLPDTDAYFKLLYALGSCSNEKLFRKIIICNPDKDVESRFASIFGPGAQARYLFTPYTFYNALNLIKSTINEIK